MDRDRPKRTSLKPLWLGLLVAVLAFAWWLSTLGEPSDATMIRRFMQHRTALVSVHGPDFVSEGARSQWRRSLRIRDQARGSESGRSRSMLEVYYGRRGMFDFISKGYAYIPEIEEPPQVTLSDDLDGLVRFGGFTYRHIEGNWYLYKLWTE